MAEPHAPLEPAVHDLLAQCNAILASHYGSRMAGLVLYGSEARGESSDESDIDLLVLLHEPFDYFRELRVLVELVYPLQLASSRLLSVKPAGASAFERGGLQLYRNARAEGVRL